jgi:hypothetical protein
MPLQTSLNRWAHRFLGLWLLAFLVAATTTLGAEEKPQTFPADTYPKKVAPLLSKYCGKCHGVERQEAGLALHLFPNVESVMDHREQWGAISEMIDFGAMPPEDQPQPTDEERKLIIDWLHSILAYDCDQEREPGTVTLRRLNRSEYDNTIRDLLGLDLNLAKDFPSDDVGEGFDNIGDVLSLPPLLLEKYVDAAQQAAEAAIVSDVSKLNTQRKSGSLLRLSGSAALNGRDVVSMVSRGMATSEFQLPRDGKYMLRLEAGAQQAGPEVAKAELTVDGKPRGVVEVKAPADDMGVYELEVDLKQGQREFSASFINDYYNPDAQNRRDRDRNLYIRALEIAGPIWGDGTELPESHRRIVIAKPSDKLSAEEAARRVLERFTSRAYRRPVRSSELDKLVGLVSLVMSKGGSYERGLQVAVSAVLTSPHFLFRVEPDRSEDPERPVRFLNSYEMASRLSYFLWSSMPDEELFRLAEEGKLQRDDVLQAQVQRMLADPKSEQLVKNFGGQWLNLRMLEDVSPDPKRFSDFGEEVRDAMRRETELFFAAIMRENRSIIDFLNGEFTFLNQRLAKYYSIPGVQGDAFRRVSLSGSRRIGVLTHASILTLTSNPTRTSPVKRGKWILENILGTVPPEPPPNAPPLDDVQKASPHATLREQMVLHRKDPVCASCHRQMDDLGFGFENYDAVGRWRDEDAGQPVNAAGELPSGEKFSGPTELVQILGQRKEEFSRALTRKMLVYALGRGLKPYDQCTVDEVVKELAKNEYRFSTLVTAIATSTPFRMRRVASD